MDDIEVVIDASKHFKYHDPSGVTWLNRISSLPSSKKNLRRALKERMQLLAQAYISLATFIDDDLVDFLEMDREIGDTGKIQRAKRIYEKVMRDMEKLRNEISTFDPTKMSSA